jgi:hypothetical protein
MAKMKSWKYLLLAAILAVIGCSAGNPMVGTWKQGPTTAEFKPDGTYTISLGGPVTASIEGKYEVSDKKVYLSPSSGGSVKVTGTVSDDGKSFTAMGLTFQKQ